MLRFLEVSCVGMGLVWASEQLLLAAAPAASVMMAAVASLVVPTCKHYHS